MADYTLAELIDPDTEDERVDYLVTELAHAPEGYPTTNWTSGAPSITLIRTFAKGLADGVGLVAEIAKGGFLELASKAWLPLLTQSWFSTAPYPATFAVVRVRLTCAAGFGPAPIAANQLWLGKVGTTQRYNSTNAGTVTVPDNGTLDLDIQAEFTGSVYNVALGTALELLTPLPGVTAAPLETTVGSGTAMVTAGADEEPNALVISRARAKWATVGIQKVADAYLYLVTHVPGVTTVRKVYLDDTNPRGPGTLDLWLAGDAGPLTPTDEAAVAAYVEARRSPSADVQTRSADARVVDVAAVVFYYARYTGALTEAADRLTRAINELPIGARLALGEDELDPSDVVALIRTVPGVHKVEKVTINGLAASLELAPNEVATPGTFTFTAIPTT